MLRNYTGHSFSHRVARCLKLMADYLSHSHNLLEYVNKARASTTFSANVTASLALPDVPKKSDKKKTTHFSSSTHSITDLLNSFSNLIANPTAPISFPNIPTSNQANILVIPPKDDEAISKQIIAMEDKRQKLSDQIASNKILAEEVELMEQQIKEHAARRVDLFFYLLMAVYGKNVIVEKDKTVKQHGKGSKKRNTQACHSSLFPNVKLTSIPTLWALFKVGSCPSLSGTQFEDSLNMTVELPSIVNAFDGHLEGKIQPTKYIKALLNILNKTSKKEIDPKTGMNEFFKVMKEFFDHFEQKYIIKNALTTCEATKKVWLYEKEGTFSVTNKQNNTMLESYFYLMLRLSPKEIIKAQKNPTQLPIYYRQLQAEIYHLKPVSKATLVKP